MVDQNWERAYRAAAAAAVASVAARFQHEPASFLSERDLQAMLFANLFDMLADRPLQWTAADVGLSKIGRATLYANPVKTEYSLGNTQERFDVAVLSPVVRPKQHAWTQSVAVGIEVKFWQAGGGGWGIGDDVRKLEAYKRAPGSEPFTGLALLFCHSAEKAVRRDVEAAGAEVWRPGLDLPDTPEIARWAVLADSQR